MDSSVLKETQREGNKVGAYFDKCKPYTIFFPFLFQWLCLKIVALEDESYGKADFIRR